MAGIYVGNFSSAEDVFQEFAVEEAERKHIVFLFASYDTPDYEGYADVLYRDERDGKLYEVHGSHCSCYGLEECWAPEETTVVAVRYQLEHGKMYGGYEAEMRQVLAALEAPVSTNVGPTTHLDCETHGHDLPEGARFCIRCGLRVATDQTARL